MKYFIVLVLVAVAAATPLHLKPQLLAGDLAEIQQIVDAINSPSTDPATGLALQAMLYEMLGVGAPAPEAIHVGPTLVEGNEPISVGPVIVDHPIALPEIVSPEIVAPEIVAPEIVAPTPVPSAPESQSAPLVQIIVNVQSQQSAAGPSPGLVTSPIEVPVTLPELVHIVDQAPELVNVVDQAPELVNVVDQAPELVNVVDQAPELVNVVDQAPELVNVVDEVPETINVVQPILPPTPVNVPETLN